MHRAPISSIGIIVPHTFDACVVMIAFVFSFIYNLYAKNFKNIEEKLNFYKERYEVNCLNEKITDNFGNGFDALYGTRNMKPILHGIAYRGGANNYYHKTNKRHNHNPLPPDGLENLFNEGFSVAIYLYGTNFSTAKKMIASDTDTLKYIQNSGMNIKTQREIAAILNISRSYVSRIEKKALKKLLKEFSVKYNG